MAGKHFFWDSYLYLLRKAHRDLDRLKGKTPNGLNDDAYMDDVFNLVCTINHIFDWVRNYDPQLGPVATNDMVAREKNGPPYESVLVVNELCNGLKHQVPEPGKHFPGTQVNTTTKVLTAWRGRSGLRMRGSRNAGRARMRGATNPIRVRGSNAVRVVTRESGFVFEVEVTPGHSRPVVDIAAEALVAWEQLLADHQLPTV